MNSFIKSIKNFFDQHIWVTLFAIRANKTILKGIASESFIIESIWSKEIPKAIAILEKFDKEYLERKKTLEEKARALLLIITASITLTVTVLTYIYNLKEIPYISLFILIGGYLFLIISIVDVIATLNTTEYYYITKEDYFKPKEGSANLVFFDFEQGNEYIEILYRNLALNAKKNLVKQNRIYAAFENLRNGIILICIFFILSVFQKIFSNSNEIPNQNPIIRDSCIFRYTQRRTDVTLRLETLPFPHVYNSNKRLPQNKKEYR